MQLRLMAFIYLTHSFSFEYAISHVDNIQKMKKKIK